MRFSFASTLVVTLAASASANSWFGSAGAYIYDKWHETELERWLSDHGIPHPSPSDRKSLQSTVKANWNDKTVSPYTSWDAPTLQKYLSLKGQQAKKGTEKDAKSLVEQVKLYWTETEDSANQAYGNVKDWIFDTWSDSQLKAFADKHGIPVPQPRQRDSLLAAVRDNYQSAAEKAKETANYPGDWLYASWSDSDLKAWFDERGYPVPQPNTRDSMIAALRRQSRLASLQSQDAYASVTSAAAAAQQSLSDALLDSWSDSQIKEWADKNGIKVPQGSKRNELLALARKHRARLYGDSASATAESLSASGASAYGAATSKANNEYASATDGFAYYTNLVKQQIGLAGASAASATDAAAASAASATNAAGASASSLSGAAAKSASSSSSSLSKSAASASSAASKSAKSASYEAAASASSAKQEL
ncbi:hypothetical protein J3E72DRAFT_388054 [Bipolaris maydis]|uniref:uncharacterized protein n=1 Tax=Cochliobolus heterostrophus TaxID=5016 RepID=UPI0024D01A4C|nr:hypothetical protein J3E73DRAFT_6490 [Bipolaris maydis]KAJ5057188.1 hypothetical protein J3E74DRAFT_251852 [Bipolaris maydis]KAJ6194281.1 hypothetical protein J3E72DRAFT_388054 [Bipolaris maydis]KAJ6266036.1 hypothetical protein PSV08DRAFT_365971 [Bipolaris maydis]KAJ6281051.1 hypothetical protein J3E71DRAFT_218950 [Bipolaris maydis]